MEETLSALSVCTPPNPLPGRDEEREQLTIALRSRIASYGGDPLFVCGVPGTGKTVTARHVVQSLQEDESVAAFHYIEINCFKYNDPTDIYRALFLQVHSDSCRRVGAERSAELVDNFQCPDHEPDHVTVILLDEVDSMKRSSEKQRSVLYNILDWGLREASGLVFIIVANTINFPDLLGPRSSSRMGTSRIIFPPYTAKQMMQIVTERLDSVPGSIDFFGKTALDVATSNAAKSAGDARTILSIVQKSLENFIDDDNVECTQVEVYHVRDALSSLRSWQSRALEAASWEHVLILCAISDHNRCVSTDPITVRDIWSRSQEMISASVAMIETRGLHSSSELSLAFPSGTDAERIDSIKVTTHALSIFITDELTVLLRQMSDAGLLLHHLNYVQSEISAKDLIVNRSNHEAVSLFVSPNYCFC